MMHLGIDVGGTKTEVCLLSSLKEPLMVVFRERMFTHPDKTLEAFFSRLRNLLAEQLSVNQILFDQIETIGVGLPGSINPMTMIMSQGSVAFFKNIDLKKTFKEGLSIPGTPYSGEITFDNDANCFALAETYFGAGKNWAKKNCVALHEISLVGITLGTGVGGGIVIGGSVVKGSHGGAGEIGHVNLVEDGRECFCGSYGCSEQYLSGNAFEYFYNSQANPPQLLNASEIFELEEKNDPIAKSVVASYQKMLARFISKICNILNPHVIVLGGGLSAQKRIYTCLNELAVDSCFLKPAPAIVQNELGGSAGVIGAALIAAPKYLKRESY